MAGYIICKTFENKDVSKNGTETYRKKEEKSGFLVKMDNVTIV